MTSKRGFVGILISLLIILPFITAQNALETAPTQTVDASTGYTWLANISKTRNPTIPEQSYIILALLGEGGKEQTVSNMKQKLKDEEDTQKICWPKTACKTRDSAIATLALNKAGATVDKEVKKLKEQLFAALRTGEWRIQIDAPSNGTCTASWNDNKQKKDFKIEGPTVLGTSRKYYINVATDIPDGNKLLALPNSKISVDCSTLSGTITLSLVYAKSATELYIVQSFPNTAKADMIIQNACFPDAIAGQTCNYDATLETTWALVEAGEPLENLGTLPYLYSTLSNDDTQRAYLARLLSVSGKTSISLLDQLTQNQKSDGSWKSGDVFTTGLAVLAFVPSSGNYQDAVTNGRLALQKRQANDGSWKQNIRDTAIALLALKGEISGATVRLPANTRTTGTIEICSNQEDDDNNGFTDCADIDVCGNQKICHCENQIKDLDEKDVDCGGKDCKACEGTESETSFTDQETEEETFTATTKTCTTDLDCRAEESCTAGTCAVKKGVSTGLIVFIIILSVLLIGGIIFYLQFVRTGKIDLKNLFRKRTKPSFDEFKQMAEFKPIQQPKSAQPTRKPAARPTKSTEDEALDRSLKEAEKLLHKK